MYGLFYSRSKLAPVKAQYLFIDLHFIEAYSQVNDFQYLDSWIDQTEKELRIRKAKAYWATSQKLRTVWKSNLSR